jgi:hypothetical protein
MYDQIYNNIHVCSALYLSIHQMYLADDEALLGLIIS